MAEKKETAAKAGQAKKPVALAKAGQAKKAPAKKIVAKKAPAKKAPTKKLKRYFEGIGRRKSAVARVRITEGPGGDFIVNDKEGKDYFYTEALIKRADESMRLVQMDDKFTVSVHVNGSGPNAQADAVRLGAARALVKFDIELRTQLKRAGFLRRDPRKVERKKFGLKKARRAPQWTKR